MPDVFDRIAEEVQPGLHTLGSILRKAAEIKTKVPSSPVKPAGGLDYTLAHEGEDTKDDYLDTTGHRTRYYGVKSTPELEAEFARHVGDPKAFWKAKAGENYNRMQPVVNKALARLGIRGVPADKIQYFHDPGYQMGANWLGKFPNAAAAMKDFMASPSEQGLAAIENHLKDSLWFKQQSPRRAGENIAGMLSFFRTRLPVKPVMAAEAYNNYMKAPI